MFSEESLEHFAEILSTQNLEVLVSYRTPREWRQKGLTCLVYEHCVPMYTDAKDFPKLHTAYVYT